MREQYLKDPNLCIFCKKPIPYKKRRNKFCNHSCSASFNNIDIVRNITNGNFIKKQCKECEKTTTNQKFCSRKCSNIFKTKIVKEKIENGIYFTLEGGSLFLKNYLIKKRKHQCEKCKNTEWLDQKIPLNLHHRNGDAMDNNLLNLRLLCGNCHALTPNFGRRNKKSSRTTRYN